jgi:hypothetical protein
MPLREIDIKKYKIQIAEKDEAFVWIGPCSVKKLDLDIIVLDGRQYECGGTVYLADGLVLQASFRIKKTEGPLLIEDSIYTKIEDVWYKLGEPDFYSTTELEKEDVFPIEWEPDIPLEGIGKGPFKMDFEG